MSIPSGKGLFVRTTRNLSGLAKLLRQAGFTWVAPFTQGIIAATVRQSDAFRNEGLDVYPCMLNTPERHAAQIAFMADAAAKTGSAGIILDPELEYKGHVGAAVDIMRKARATGLSVGVTSYGRAKSHPTLPWQVLSTADWGLPQVYSRENDLDFDNDGIIDALDSDPGYVATGVKEWAGWGFRVVIPILGTHIKRGPNNFVIKPLNDFKHYLTSVPVVRGCAFYTQLTSIQEHPEQFEPYWQVLADFDPTKSSSLLDNLSPGISLALRRLRS